MERGKINEVLSMIKGIEEKNADLENVLSSLSILSRKKMLEEITQDIIKNNEIMKMMGVHQELMSKSEGQKEPELIQMIIDSTLEEIKSDPSKKIIFIKDFLDKLLDISDNDRNVMLQTLKDSDIEDIRNKFLSLTKIFKLGV